MKRVLFALTVSRSFANAQLVLSHHAQTGFIEVIFHKGEVQ